MTFVQRRNFYLNPPHIASGRFSLGSLWKLPVFSYQAMLLGPSALVRTTPSWVYLDNMGNFVHPSESPLPLESLHKKKAGGQDLEAYGREKISTDSHSQQVPI